MGYETKCRPRVDDRSGKIREAEVTVLLQTDELIVKVARVSVTHTAESWCARWRRERPRLQRADADSLRA
jgi:hypothetical protein